MSWVWIAVLGGLVGLDAASFPQIMVSRPLVAGALTGLVFGRPTEGLAIGLILETFDLVVLPVGAARYPESGTAAVAAAGAYLTAGPLGLDPPLVAVVILVGLVWELVAGRTVRELRNFNERLVGNPALAGTLDAGSLERRHLAAIGLDFLRAALVAALGTLVGVVLLRALVPIWMEAGDLWAARLLGVVTAGAVGAALSVFGGWSRGRGALLAGLACGFLLLLAT